MTGRFILIVAGLALSTALGAGPVYHWVDEGGISHYADQPGSRDAKRIDVKVRKSDRWATEAAERANLEQTAENQKQCNAARQRLDLYKRTTTIFREDAEGKPEALGDEERTQLIADTEKEVKALCGGGDR